MKTKNTKPFPITNLEYLYNQKKIWLNPDYQRGSVWTTSQKQLLIDSLLRDIDIPKLYFRAVNKNGYEYEVVDGQQRLRSIFEYLKGGVEGYGMPLDADSVDGHEIKGRKFDQLHTDIQMKLRVVPLDTVVLSSDYTDDDIEEVFLRLQNGTPLNAPEKRRAIPGNMRNIVQKLSENPIFHLCSFKDIRFAYEDAVAKILHLLLAGTITDIRPVSITRTYNSYKNINDSNPAVAKLEKSFRFVTKAFKGLTSPCLKKFSIITLSYLTAEMLERYNLNKFPTQFAQSYTEFEISRSENEELPEDQQNGKLAAYTDAARSDSIQDMRYRHELLREFIVRSIPELVLKDANRDFSEEQRVALFLRDKGVCQMCRQQCDEASFHADHIIAHSNGGETKISNGQVLCASCNKKKSNKSPDGIS